MLSLTTIAAAIGLLAATGATQDVSTYVNAAVPTGVPVAGNYTGDLRPQIHFSPPKFFMNDPNGMFVDANGTWHVYYQYNPTGSTAGNQHWGHATSQDLYHWINQPIALFPPTKNTPVFSGSAVIDVNNTSGFFPNQNNGVVAITTLAHYNEDGTAGTQTQAIAYSHDGGFTFQYYNGNPVINSASSQFRDPKVIWYEDHWVAVISYAQEFVIGFFTSPDLKSWTHASNFSTYGLLGTQYECPNIVQIPVRDFKTKEKTDTKFLLTISAQPGAPLGGSITEYFPGDFNGTHFTPLDGATRLTDFAKDNYAAQYFYGNTPDGNAINLGWASNWQYAQQVPTGNREGWRSSLTLPRVNYLTYAPRIGLIMVDEVYDLSPVMDQELNSTKMGNGDVVVDYSGVDSGALYVEVNVTNINTRQIQQYTTLNITFSNPNTGEALYTGFYFGGDTPFFINRGAVKGFDNIFFTDKFSVSPSTSTSPSSSPLPDRTANWTMKAVIDRSILEVFINQGVHSATVLFFPEGEPLSQCRVAAQDMPSGTEVSVAVWGLKSAWAKYQNEQGTVLGNVTMSATNSTSSGSAGQKRHMVYEGKFSY
ncbi:glycosyl hydrolase [Microdochium bolleyi]|uniref:Glycosyl hydrolase n=1 Tax=Microdochium bolleyi TaxID=196109 RepID=A0A136JGA8_9PEZI|nr:glycosyl hydrolase [Microdochium bolleyi]